MPSDTGHRSGLQIGNMDAESRSSVVYLIGTIGNCEYTQQQRGKHSPLPSHFTKSISCKHFTKSISCKHFTKPPLSTQVYY
jgi:hypothetical protein